MLKNFCSKQRYPEEKGGNRMKKGESGDTRQMDAVRFLPDCLRGLTEKQVRARLEQGLYLGENGGLGTGKRKRAAPFLPQFWLLSLASAAFLLASGASWAAALPLAAPLASFLLSRASALAVRLAGRRIRQEDAPVQVVREGCASFLPAAGLVLDDIVLLESGSRVRAGCVIRTGLCQADESSLTGESVPVRKGKGDRLAAGSLLVSGRVRAQTDRTGEGGNPPAGEKEKGGAEASPAAAGLRHIGTAAAAFFLLAGVFALCQRMLFPDSFPARAAAAAWALAGALPQGLALLACLAETLLAFRLAAGGVLAQEPGQAQALAGAQVLCLDKTGVLTQGEMELECFVPLAPVPQKELSCAAAALAPLCRRDAAAALQAGGPPAPGWAPEQSAAFSAVRGWCGAFFPGRGSYILGEAGRILSGRRRRLEEKAARHEAQGFQVFLLARSPQPLSGRDLPAGLLPLALVLLREKLREGAAETFSCFAARGTAVKIVSGDRAAAAVLAAKRAGLPGAENSADLSALATEEAVEEAAGRYTVFGSAAPWQKQALVRAWRKKGLRTAVVGDGDNDAPALAEGGCAAAMACGSGAARDKAGLLLRGPGLGGLLRAAEAGRRAYWQVRRPAALFLANGLFSAVAALCALALPQAAVPSPAQLALAGLFTVWIPALALALAPCPDSPPEDFLPGVLWEALPGGISMAAGQLALLSVSRFLGLSQGQGEELAMMLQIVSGLMVLFHLGRPLSSLRATLCLCLGALALLTAALFPSLFFPAPLTLPMALALPLLLAFSAAACGCAYALAGRVRGRGLREGAAPARTKNPPA